MSFTGFYVIWKIVEDLGQCFWEEKQLCLIYGRFSVEELIPCVVLMLSAPI